MRIYLSRPHMSGKELEYVKEAFESNYIAPLGPHLTTFEEKTSQYLGDGLHCVGLSSGSAALHLALRIHGVGQGDEVWVSSMTFAGGIFPVLYEKATPVFFDLNPKSWTLDADLVEAELEQANQQNRLPKAIVPTDLYGQSCDLDRFEAMADRYEIPLIVDSAESFGAEYSNGRKCGSGGDTAILSFNGNKIITTSGGGMLCTKHRKVADEARFLATQARDPAPHYEHSTYGYNYRLSNISAAIGVGQLEILDERVRHRRANFERYKAAFDGTGITFMPEPDGVLSSRWLTTAVFDPEMVGMDRETIRLALLSQEIESRPLWKPMHKQPLFAGTRYIGEGFDEKIFRDGLCLPSGSDMSEAEQKEVITLIHQQIGQ